MRSLSALRLPARFFRLPFVSAVQADRGRMLLLVAPAQIVQHFQKVVQYLAAFRLGAVGSQKQYAHHLAGHPRDRRLALRPTRHRLVSCAQLRAESANRRPRHRDEAGMLPMPDSTPSGYGCHVLVSLVDALPAVAPTRRLGGRSPKTAIAIAATAQTTRDPTTTASPSTAAAQNRNTSPRRARTHPKSRAAPLAACSWAERVNVFGRNRLIGFPSGLTSRLACLARRLGSRSIA